MIKKCLLDEQHPENTDPNILNELHKKLGKLAIILVKWNQRDLRVKKFSKADDDIYAIWNLFEDYALKQWNGPTPPNSDSDIVGDSL